MVTIERDSFALLLILAVKSLDENNFVFKPLNIAKWHYLCAVKGLETKKKTRKESKNYFITFK